MKGITLSVYKDAYLGNCSNGGVSSRYIRVTLVGDGVPELFEASESSPAVKLVQRTIGGKPYVHAEPVEPKPPGTAGWMAGGSLVGTCDSRFSRLIESILGVSVPAISLHDRCETPQSY